MCWRNSRANGCKTKAVTKAMRRMCWWNSRADGCKTKAVTKAVRRMRPQSSRNDRSIHRWSSRTTKAMVKVARKVHQRSYRTDGRKTKVMRRWRRWSTHTNGHKTKGSGMDELMRLTNPESIGDKRTAVAWIRRTPRQQGQEANSLEIDAWLTQCQLLWPAQSKSSRSTQNNNKENKKTSTRKNGKRGRVPAMAEEKK